ncbi:ATP-binding protein [Kitasatospora sp. NBC_00070]|uniref:ATP-binding protein n=1 Tax=Kitasatospora sp. NBC_00070 TaxID=2975962 RepID=UPI003252F171
MRQPPSLQVELDGRPGSVRAARSATAGFLRELADRGEGRLSAHTREDVELVVAELVGNACRHAPGPCRLTVVVSPGDTVAVAVEDSSPRLHRTPAGPGPPRLGLTVVTALGQGVHVLRTGAGKMVTTTVPDR